MRRRCARTARAGLAGLLWVGTAHASGFALFEQGARGMGLAGAYAAQSQDASAIFHNAAGIAFLRGRHAYLGATLIHPDSEFRGANPFPGEAVRERGAARLSVPPALDYSHQLSQRMVVGLGVHVPYELRTRWANRDTSFSGRFIAKLAEIRSYSLNPALAYKLADRLALGAGLDVRLSQLALERNVALVNPFTQRVQDVARLRLESRNRLALGFNLGVLARASEALALGASYRHGVRTDFSGSARVVPVATGNAQLDALVAQRLPAAAGPFSSEIEFPALVTLGVQYAWRDFILAADVNFQRWSSFDSVPLTLKASPELSGVLEQGWRNARAYRVGAERRLNDAWTVRGGYFFDETPVPVESVGPLLPDASRHGAALGASFRRGRLRIDGANWLVFFRERSTEGRSRDNYNGSYSGFAALLSVSIGLTF